MHRDPSKSQITIIRAIRAFLIMGALISLFTERYSTAFIAMVTLFLTLVPFRFARTFSIKLPGNFSTAIVFFIFATLFLGEAFDFYERYWWWDLFLHGGSAISFGLIGTVVVLMLFEGDRFAAPPLAIAVISFCLAVSIGAFWEIFEFLMDQSFGTNMQKSGLPDTMGDLIVDTFGAAIGATAGYFYLKGQRFGGLSATIADFVASNRHLFKKAQRKQKRKRGASDDP